MCWACLRLLRGLCGGTSIAHAENATTHPRAMQGVSSSGRAWQVAQAAHQAAPAGAFGGSVGRQSAPAASYNGQAPSPPDPAQVGLCAATGSRTEHGACALPATSDAGLSPSSLVTKQTRDRRCQLQCLRCKGSSTGGNHPVASSADATSRAPHQRACG
jgi:hypothetical protein